MSVFVIEQGDYSDYRVVGVFTTREKAQLVVDALKGENENWGEEATIAEWPLDPIIDELSQGRHPFLVWMRRDGTVERCDPWHVQTYEIAGSVRVWQRSQAPAYSSETPDVLDATVWATDAEHAVKIVNEHRARMIADGTFQ